MTTSTPPRGLPVLAAAALLAAGGARAQQDFTRVEIVTQPVAGAVWQLVGQGGNIGVSAGPDGLLIVDDQFEPLAGRIIAALDALDGDGPGTPRYVVNTHWHSDHVGGNAVFGRGATLVAHAAVRRRMAAGQDVRGRTVPPAPPQALPVITYDGGLSVHFNGEEIRVRHLPPGHTDGDSMVWFMRSNVVHLGDQFFPGRFPFVDLQSGGSVTGLRRSIGMLLAELPADVRIIPGHGAVCGLTELATYERMLADSIAHVSAALAEGRSSGEIAAAGWTAWEGWGAGFIAQPEWLATVAASLARDAEAAAPEGAPAGGAALPPAVPEPR